MLKKLNQTFFFLVFIFLYAPILIVIVFAFNKAKSRSVFNGFTLNWFFELFKDRNILKALNNSLILATFSSIIAVIITTVALLQIVKNNKKEHKVLMRFNLISLINPDITLGISLMLFLQFILNIFNLQLGFFSALISHITIILPFAYTLLLPKFQQIDPNFLEAALDLGCTPFIAFFKVILPQIYSTLISTLIVAFTISFDEFTVSYFTSGNSFQTLPVLIYSMVKKRISPKINALFTIIFFLAIISLISISIIKNLAHSQTKN